MPFPYAPHVELEEYGEVRAIRMARRFAGHELLDVRCFVVHDTLVDTGLESLGGLLLDHVRAEGLRRALITHHHEDHSGNAARLVEAGLEVLASPATAAILRRGFPIRFYEHLCWGKIRPARVGTFGDRVRLGDHEAVVVPAPGHAVDQVAFHVPSRGWLFPGDAFVHERIKYFRRDEDFHATVGTMERFLELDFEALLCPHRPRLTNGKQAIRLKLQWLRDLEGRIRHWHEQGVPVAVMARRLDRATWFSIPTISLGDASAANLIRSCLSGPVPRPEIVAALDGLAPRTPGGSSDGSRDGS